MPHRHPVAADPARRGTLRLRFADPSQPPELDLNLYTERSDFDAILTGLRSVAEMSSVGPLASRLASRSCPSTPT